MPALILLVDPDDSIVDALSRLMKRVGFEVVTATNERDCLHHLCRSAPDVFVIEPDTGGQWGNKLITDRHPESPPDVPTVVVSRLNPDELKINWETSVYHWHTKPVKTEDLVATLKQAAQLTQ